MRIGSALSLHRREAGLTEYYWCNVPRDFVNILWRMPVVCCSGGFHGMIIARGWVWLFLPTLRGTEGRWILNWDKWVPFVEEGRVMVQDAAGQVRALSLYRRIYHSFLWSSYSYSLLKSLKLRYHHHVDFEDTAMGRNNLPWDLYLRYGSCLLYKCSKKLTAASNKPNCLESL